MKSQERPRDIAGTPQTVVQKTVNSSFLMSAILSRVHGPFNNPGQPIMLWKKTQKQKPEARKEKNKRYGCDREFFFNLGIFINGR
jgi:hypothetical protein